MYKTTYKTGGFPSSPGGFHLVPRYKPENKYLSNVEEAFLYLGEQLGADSVISGGDSRYGCVYVFNANGVPVAVKMKVDYQEWQDYYNAEAEAVIFAEDEGVASGIEDILSKVMVENLHFKKDEEMKKIHNTSTETR